MLCQVETCIASNKRSPRRDRPLWPTARARPTDGPVCRPPGAALHPRFRLAPLNPARAPLLRRRARCLGVQYSSAGLGFTVRSQTKSAAWTLARALNQLAASQRWDCYRPCPEQQVVRHPAQGLIDLDHTAQAVEHIAQRMLTRPGILQQQRQ